jgi:hypothetical protein
LWRTPCSGGSSAVISEAWDGSVSGAGETATSKRTPSVATVSKFGVCARVAP